MVTFEIDIEDETYERIQQYARANGLTFNEAINQIIYKAEERAPELFAEFRRQSSNKVEE